MEKRHQIPIVEIEGLNIEEKETRHDAGKKIKRARIGDRGQRQNVKIFLNK